ncbi:MAG: hypothetical protein R3Y43_02615 [Alphaproteobacteria bacterium]
MQTKFAPKSTIIELQRKTLHLSSLWIPILIYLTYRTNALLIFGTLTIFDLILEYANFKKQKWARLSYGAIFHKILRSFETKHNHFLPSGAFYVLLASFLCALLFSKEIAVISISVMLIADANAALFGKLFGKHKLYKNKSVEGSFAFLISALLVMLVCHFLHPINYASIIACITATILEIYSKQLKLDDNLSIPLSVGFILSIL